MNDLRQRIVAEALTWEGTPYIHMGRVKGAGCDCATLLIEVFAACGIIERPSMLEWYPPEWNLHQSEEIYLNRMQPYVERIEDYRRGPGDIVMFKMGRTIAHGGIMLPDNRMIHSWKPSRGVSIVGLSNDYWRKHYYGAFRVRGVD